MNSVRSFVLRAGRISHAQKRSYETLFHLYAKKFPFESLNVSEFFGNERPVTVEIGFGMGTATSIIAGQNPGINYLGIEVHRPGIGRLLMEIEQRGLKNIRIIEGDAVEILKTVITDNSVSAFHLFFPDPWPKKRHHKRRLVTRPFTDMLAEKLLPGGYIYMASDWTDYSDWALRELTATAGLSNRYEGFAQAQSWRPQTEFERKGIRKKHEIRELFFEKTVVQ